MTKMRHFLKFFFASQIFGILGVIFILLVVVLYKKTDFLGAPAKEFLWHPVLMALSFGYLFGTSITIYRALRHIGKIHLKRLHAAIHLAVIAFAIGGLVTTFDLHYAYGIPHLRNLHGLFGIISMIFFCIQWLLSFLAFLYPKAPGFVRGILMKYHIVGGLVLFITSLCSVLTGINEYYSKSKGPLNGEQILLNFAGFFFLINAILIAYMVLPERYKRQPTDEDCDDESEE